MIYQSNCPPFNEEVETRWFQIMILDGHQNGVKTTTTDINEPTLTT